MGMIGQSHYNSVTTTLLEMLGAPMPNWVCWWLVGWGPCWTAHAACLGAGRDQSDAVPYRRPVRGQPEFDPISPHVGVCGLKLRLRSCLNRCACACTHYPHTALCQTHWKYRRQSGASAARVRAPYLYSVVDADPSRLGGRHCFNANASTGIVSWSHSALVPQNF